MDYETRINRRSDERRQMTDQPNCPHCGAAQRYQWTCWGNLKTEFLCDTKMDHEGVTDRGAVCGSRETAAKMQAEIDQLKAERDALAKWKDEQMKMEHPRKRKNNVIPSRS